MITGAHFLLYSKDADADRAFFRDVLEWHSVDLGHKWLIFRVPPAEMAVHPGSGDFIQQHGDENLLGIVLYLMTDNLVSDDRQSGFNHSVAGETWNPLLTGHESRLGLFNHA